jgi:hypothetical protein
MKFSNRHEIEQYLASQTTSGVIIEIGCGFGHGLIALDKGNINSLPIYGIDPYLEYNDPLGGQYDETTYIDMQENTKDIYFSHINGNALEVANGWQSDIGLLWIDLSMPYKTLKPIVNAWLKHIQPDGIIAITGLPYDVLGTGQIMQELCNEGYERLLPEQNLVAVMKKRENHTRRAAFYIIGDFHSYVKEAEVSAKSVAKHLKIDTHLFATKNVLEAMGTNPIFTRTIELPGRKYPGWYRNQVWYLNIAIEHLKHYGQLLYLDTDTFVCRDCSGIWDILNNYDMAQGHAAGRGGTPTAVDCPSEFCTLGVGVNFFNNSLRIKDFFREWLKQYNEHYDVYGETDEGPFRDLLYLNEQDIRFYVLAPEEHCRFGFGVWVNGSVSILHGRVDQPLAEVAEEINKVKTMRLYRWGSGMLWWHIPQ